MKTISEGRQNITQIWGYQKPDNIRYRLMKYVLQLKVKEGLLLHNVVTGQLVLLTEEEEEEISNLPNTVLGRLEELIQNHFLVPEAFNEYKSVNQLRKICRFSSTGDAINHYIILPTTFCNAHCFYCYESDYPQVHMTEETANLLVDYIDIHRKGKNVTINWFGGEPLVGIKRIDQISRGLKDRDIPFTSSMISNGYLFDEEIVDKSVQLWNLQRIQITLDGTERVYNKVKAYLNVNDNPFHRVLRNIDLLSERKVHVNIRLNVDYYNKEDILALIEELGKRYSANQYVTVYLNMLFNNEGFEPVKHSYDEMLFLANIIDKYTERLKEYGLSFDNNRYLSLEFSHCMADNPHSLLIQPDGSFCRCEHENINDSYGNLKKGILNNKKLDEWNETIEPSDLCQECPVYPACYHLRNCMNSDLLCDDMLQKRNLKKQIERVERIYDQKREVK